MNEGMMDYVAEFTVFLKGNPVSCETLRTSGVLSSLGPSWREVCVVVCAGHSLVRLKLTLTRLKKALLGWGFEGAERATTILPAGCCQLCC